MEALERAEEFRETFPDGYTVIEGTEFPHPYRVRVIYKNRHINRRNRSTAIRVEDNPERIKRLIWEGVEEGAA